MIVYVQICIFNVRLLCSNSSLKIISINKTDLKFFRTKLEHEFNFGALCPSTENFIVSIPDMQIECTLYITHYLRVVGATNMHNYTESESNILNSIVEYTQLFFFGDS